MANKVTIYRGTTYPFTYNHTDTDGNPVSLVGSTVYFTVKSTSWDSDATDTAAAIKKTTTVHTNPTGGVTNWTLDDSDTYIDPGNYYFGVIVEDSDGLSDPPSLTGKFIVVPQTTNRNVGNE